MDNLTRFRKAVEKELEEAKTSELYQEGVMKQYERGTEQFSVCQANYSYTLGVRRGIETTLVLMNQYGIE